MMMTGKSVAAITPGLESAVSETYWQEWPAMLLLPDSASPPESWQGAATASPACETPDAQAWASEMVWHSTITTAENVARHRFASLENLMMQDNSRQEARAARDSRLALWSLWPGRNRIAPLTGYRPLKQRSEQPDRFLAERRASRCCSIRPPERDDYQGAS
jgi:hypothetical protein